MYLIRKIQVYFALLQLICNPPAGRASPPFYVPIRLKVSFEYTPSLLMLLGWVLFCRMQLEPQA